jgi:hypothetical protein
MSDLSSSAPGDNFDATAPEPVKPASRWEDFIDIFYAPASVFARRIGSGFGIPMLVVTVLIGVIAIANSGVMQPLMDAEFNRGIAAAMRKNPQLTPEMMEKGRAFAGTIAKVAPFFFIPAAMFLTGLVLWLVGKLVDAKETLASALMVAAYAWVPRVLEGVLNGVQGLVMDPASMNGRYRISLGLGRFFDPDTASPLLLAIIGRIDVFTIWVTVLLAIGLAVTGRIPRSKAALAAVLVWIVGALPGVFGAIQQMP